MKKTICLSVLLYSFYCSAVGGNTFCMTQEWLPVEIKGGCSLWFDINHIGTLFTTSAHTTPVVADGVAVGGLKDKSGKGFNVAVGDPSKPLLKLNRINGRPSLLFDGSDDSLSRINTILSKNAPGVTVVAVYLASVSIRGNMFAIVINSSSLNRVALTDSLTTDSQLLVGGRTLDANSFQSSETTGLTDATWRHVQAVFDTPGARLDIYINGTANGGRTYQTASNIENTNADIYISVGANYFLGEIAEIIVYEKALSTDERALIETYLKTKYAIY